MHERVYILYWFWRFNEDALSSELDALYCKLCISLCINRGGLAQVFGLPVNMIWSFGVPTIDNQRHGLKTEASFTVDILSHICIYIGPIRSIFNLAYITSLNKNYNGNVAMKLSTSKTFLKTNIAKKTILHYCVFSIQVWSRLIVAVKKSFENIQWWFLALISLAKFESHCCIHISELQSLTVTMKLS